MMSVRRWPVLPARARMEQYRRLLIEKLEGVVVSPTSNRYKHSRSERLSTGIIVIGNEILRAQVRDINSFYACRLLYEHGVMVKKISIVADDVREIASEIGRFSERYTHVVTTGGIGPTHDDVTYEALAAAFDRTMHYDPTLTNTVRNLFGVASSSTRNYKMAYVPKGVTLFFGINEATGKALAYPCVSLQNVHVFPGSPIYFQPSFRSLCKKLFADSKSFATDEIFVNAPEETFAERLSALAKEYPSVNFGSYPERNRYYKARVTIESDSEEETRKARERFCELTPPNVLVRFDREPQNDCLAKYDKFLHATHRRAIYESSFEKFLEIYRNPTKALLYLDGSVESVILAHLAHVAATKLGVSEKLRAIYFQAEDRCREIDRFVDDIGDRYNLDVTMVPCGKKVDRHRVIREFVALEPESCALLLGDRRDSSRKRNSFFHIIDDLERTEKLAVQRVLVDWSDEDVAMFATSLFLPYHAREEDWCHLSGSRSKR